MRIVQLPKDGTVVAVDVSVPPLLLVTMTVALETVSGPTVAVQLELGHAFEGVTAVTVSDTVKEALPWMAGNVCDGVLLDPDCVWPGTGPVSLPGLEQVTGKLQLTVSTTPMEVPAPATMPDAVTVAL